MNWFRANFEELYRRHLCRHSQLGVNVAHLASVAGTYLALFGLIVGLADSAWLLAALVCPYLIVLACNVPVRVFVVTLAFMGLFFAAFEALPRVSLWWYPVAVVLCYKVQAWSHLIYTRATDMTEFEKKYRKGFVLFVLLSIYELPILLNYLCFGRKDWYQEVGERGVSTPCSASIGG